MARNKKSKSPNNSSKSAPPSYSHPVVAAINQMTQWQNVNSGGTIPVKIPSGIISNTWTAAGTGPYYNQYPEEESKKIKQIDRFIIKINDMTNKSHGYKLEFFSEEEFVFSFASMYNDMINGKKYSMNCNKVIKIEDITDIELTKFSNGIKFLISPIYVMEKAKELGYDKNK